MSVGLRQNWSQNWGQCQCRKTELVSIFLKNEPTPTSFSFIFDLFKQTITTIFITNQCVCGAVIRTHDLSNMSCLPWPLDQGCFISLWPHFIYTKIAKRPFYLGIRTASVRSIYLNLSGLWKCIAKICEAKEKNAIKYRISIGERKINDIHFRLGARIEENFEKFFFEILDF